MRTPLRVLECRMLWGDWPRSSRARRPDFVLSASAAGLRRTGDSSLGMQGRAVVSRPGVEFRSTAADGARRSAQPGCGSSGWERLQSRESSVEGDAFEPLLVPPLEVGGMRRRRPLLRLVACPRDPLAVWARHWSGAVIHFRSGLGSRWRAARTAHDFRGHRPHRVDRPLLALGGVLEPFPYVHRAPATSTTVVGTRDGCAEHAAGTNHVSVFVRWSFPGGSLRERHPAAFR